MELRGKGRGVPRDSGPRRSMRPGASPACGSEVDRVPTPTFSTEFLVIMNRSSQTRALSINPAFLQEIKDSNLTLWKTFDRLNEACREPRPPASALGLLVPLLGELRDALALEFALEESYGYIEVPSAVAPVNNHLLHDIRSQHCRLYLKITELAERAEELQFRGLANNDLGTLVAEVREFGLELRDHERVEADLIRCSGSMSPQRD